MSTFWSAAVRSSNSTNGVDSDCPVSTNGLGAMVRVGTPVVVAHAGTCLALWGWAKHHAGVPLLGFGGSGTADAIPAMPRTGMLTTTPRATSCTSLWRAFNGILLLAFMLGKT